jgi:hypothetical protein
MENLAVLGAAALVKEQAQRAVLVYQDKVMPVGREFKQPLFIQREVAAGHLLQAEMDKAIPEVTEAQVQRLQLLVHLFIMLVEVAVVQHLLELHPVLVALVVAVTLELLALEPAAMVQQIPVVVVAVDMITAHQQ